MFRIFAFQAIAAAVTLTIAAASAHAQSPLGKLNLFKHIEADESRNYALAESNGPWLILCSTFTGEEGEQQAKQLVLELRREYKLTAFTHEMNWDFSGKVTGRGVDRYGRPKQMKYEKAGQRQEVAVLVGDFPSVDDPEAQRILEKIRYLKPACLDPEQLSRTGQKSALALANWRQLSSQLLSKDEELKRRGPMGKAFMVTNPMIPEEYFKPKGIDPLVEKMNEPIEHSLLKCPGKYSVKVATFTGSAITLPKEIEAVEQGKKQLRSKLEQAALDAHKMTLALRAKGYEAYEFHDHGASLVTIGSFENVGTPREDGKIEINPEIHKIMQTFGATPNQLGGKTNYVPKNIVNIPFDVQPLPVEVPQRSISSAYDRNRLSSR